MAGQLGQQLSLLSALQWRAVAAPAALSAALNTKFSQVSQRRPALVGVGTLVLLASLAMLFVRSGLDSGRALPDPSLLLDITSYNFMFNIPLEGEAFISIEYLPMHMREVGCPS